MKICILHSSYEGSSSPCNGLDPTACPQLWLNSEHHVDSVQLLKASAVRNLVQLSKRGYDVYINLCDGAWDEDRAGLEVVDTLERLNLPYTGADRPFYDPSKPLMKTVALNYGVQTAPFHVCFDMDAVEEAGRDLQFPVIVKHYNGYNSIGMTRNSRCTDISELHVQATEMIAEFGGAMVEEFLDGKEYTVLVAENPTNQNDPRVFMPIECRFPPGESFKHFDLKWVTHEGLEWKAVEDAAIEAELRAMAQKIFIGLGGVGYGRLDIRSDATGNLHFLEMNPNCGIFYPPESMGSADHILSLDASTCHASFLHHIIECAVRRHAGKQPKADIRYNRSYKSFGLFAARNLTNGEIVDLLEEKATYLVTRQHVDATWDAQKKQWFDQYAYPVSKNVFAMWSPHPSDWKPINHSCDPNSWLVGLNHVARREIKKGEEITMDYATFCVDSEPFVCLCGAATCRKLVTGRDYLAPWVKDLYGDHVTDFVKQARKARKQSGRVFAEETLLGQPVIENWLCSPGGKMGGGNQGSCGPNAAPSTV